MEVPETQGSSTELLFGLQATGIARVLLLKGRYDLGARKLPEDEAGRIERSNKHVLWRHKAPQYAWLLPQRKAILSRGGAGTIFAGLRVRLALIIAPLAVDHVDIGKTVSDFRMGLHESSSGARFCCKRQLLRSCSRMFLPESV